ncbi:MAG: hypothetical protein IKY62_01240, partial [Clostridia bacterium]|nr:hypothetical protein [Clostridia bacterium]
MKKSAKILLLVLVLALVCAAFVISAVATSQSGTDSPKYEGEVYTQLSYVDFEGTVPSGLAKHTDSVNFDDPTGTLSTDFCNNSESKIQKNVASVKSGTLKNGASNQYFSYALGAASDGEGSYPYFLIKTTEGSAKDPDTGVTESFVNRPLQVLDFDFFIPSSKFITQSAFIEFQLARFTSDTAKNYDDFQAVRISLKNDSTYGTYLQIKDKEQIFLEDAAWSHLTVALEMEP